MTTITRSLARQVRAVFRKAVCARFATGCIQLRGKPAIDARRWFLAGIMHSVCDAYYDGRWHYYDVDLGGYAGDSEKEVRSVADVLADPNGYYGSKTTLKSTYFFGADRNGAWVEKIDASKSYAFQDCHMLGLEMSFSPLSEGSE